jgi:hypothetical protein
MERNEYMTEGRKTHRRRATKTDKREKERGRKKRQKCSK